MKVLRKWLGWAGLVQAVVLAVGLLALQPVARAQDDAPAESAAQSRATSFQAVKGPSTDHVPGGALMVGAYAVAWVLLLLFLMRLAFLQARTARDIEQLERRLGEGGSGPPVE